MDNFSSLTKKEKKELRKQLQQEDQKRSTRINLVKKITIYVVIALLVLGTIFWLFKIVTSPQPGTSVVDQGREHVTEGTQVSYNSNPPTSGPHYEAWEKAGIYDQPLSDGKLVHSLEHGYIIISYNCDYPKKSFLKDFAVFAHEDNIEATPSSSSATQPHLDLSQWTQDKNCQELVAKLTDLAKKMRVWKLILVPRPSLDERIALTAWARIDKFNSFDEKRIVDFINAFRDHGPEKTME